MTRAAQAPGVQAEIGLCLLLAAADGEISDEELAALTTRVGRLLGDDFPLGRLGDLVESELTSISDLGVDDYVAELPRRIAPDRRASALRAACEVACADGLSPEEEDMIHAAGQALGVDPSSVVQAVGHKDTIHTGLAPGHEGDGEPDESGRVLAARLAASGWVDPMDRLRDAGIVGGVGGPVGLEYRSPTGHLLRFDHDAEEGTAHLAIEDDTGRSSAFVIFAAGHEEEVAVAILAMQDDLSLDNAPARLGALLGVARVCIPRDGELVELPRGVDPSDGK